MNGKITLKSANDTRSESRGLGLPAASLSMNPLGRETGSQAMPAKPPSQLSGLQDPDSQYFRPDCSLT
jgi:hypothetical protein